MINPSEVGKAGELVRLRTLESIWIQGKHKSGLAFCTDIIGSGLILRALAARLSGIKSARSFLTRLCR